MRLGDLDALKEGLEYHFHPTDQKYETDRQWAVGYNAGLNRALHSIFYAHTIDAVPVVRCKDCEDGELIAKMPSGCDHIYCHIHKEWVTPDYFCGSGERKDGEG